MVVYREAVHCGCNVYNVNNVNRSGVVYFSVGRTYMLLRHLISYTCILMFQY